MPALKHRTWLQLLDMPADVLAGLAALLRDEGPWPAGDVSPRLAPEVLAGLWASVGDATPAPGRRLAARRCPDGLVLDCSAREQGADFRGELLFCAQSSGQLGREVFRAYLTSAPVVARPGASVAALLAAVHPGWKSVRAAGARADGKTFPVSISREPGASEEFVLSEADVGRLGLCVEGPRPGAETLGAGAATLVKSAAGVVLRLGARDEAVYEVFPRRFGVIAESVRPGTYVRGARAVLGAVLGAAARAPSVSPAPALDAALADPDALVQVVRSMALRTTYPATGALVGLFRVLGVAAGAPQVARGRGVNVYPLSLQTQGGEVCPRACVQALRLRGVPPREALCGVSAAFGVFLRLHVLRDAALRCPVLLDSALELHGAGRQWRARVLAAAARAHMPASTLQWLGREVCVSVIRDGLGDAVVFRDDTGPFAIAGSPRCFVEGAAYAHTPFAAALALGREPAGAPPAPPAALAMVRGDSLRAAACRLAHIDLLTSAFPAFAPHARRLRSVWLHSEKVRLHALAPDDKAFCVLMGVLAQLAALPPGCNFWASVPYMPAAAVSAPLAEVLGG